MGAGYHGGFGATKGSALKILPSSGSSPTIKGNVSKHDIINALKSVTDMSTLIAENIENKNIGVYIIVSFHLETMVLSKQAELQKRHLLAYIQILSQLI